MPISFEMELTKEQINIINATGDIKINAVAGSGKTTTIIEYAKARPKNSKILYLAFNKSVKLEAAKKFTAIGLDNVNVETAHSLAFKHIVYNSHFKIKQQAYKTHEIAALLGLQGNGEKHAEYIIANHINNFIAYFCNSDKQKVQELNYLDVVEDSKAKTFVKTFYQYIELQTRLLLGKMNTGEIEITHDFYLKKFQLSNPQLHYDFILFDEGQDASPAMLDIFFKQPATKVIVGDTHQQIYGWRFAVNSLQKANFTAYNLSTSFRFNQGTAGLAMNILQWKNHLENYTPQQIFGKGSSKENKVKAILARTNLGLLLKAIEYVTEKKNIKHIYFEGNINSYTYADEGASLYDVLNLKNNKHQYIKDKLIGAMKDMQELEEYIEKTDDKQLAMMLEIVKEYGNDIPEIIKKIKEKHVDNDEKEKAEMIFSTVHRCKGIEYDSVQIVNDFINEKKLEKSGEEDKKEERNIDKLNEEINLLYVAVTRSRNSIHIPEALMPKNFPATVNIHILKDEAQKEKQEKNTITKNVFTKTAPAKIIKEKAYSITNVREKFGGAYKPWTNDLDEELTSMFYDGVNIKDLAKHFGRTKGAIDSRLMKLGLE